MKFLKFALISLVFLSFSSPLSAQENAVTQNMDEISELKAELITQIQDPVSKIVEFNLKLNSNIDSDRVKLTWTSTGPNTYAEGQNYSLAGLNASGELRISKGQSYSVPVSLKIHGSGVNELIGKVEIFLTEGTKVVTVRTNFGSNTDGEVLPITEAYTQAKNLNTVKNIVTIIVIIIFVLISGYFGLKRFLKWLDSDERKLQE